MNAITGNFGKLLDVDLSSGKITDYNVPEEYYRLYLGGKGLASADDDLPDRFKTETLHYEEGESVISQEKLDYMLNEYYEFRGWEKDGKPSKATIERLKLPNF